MNARITSALIALLLPMAAGCFQEVDEGVTGSVLPASGSSTFVDDGGATGDDGATPPPFLPAPFDVDAAQTEQCEAGSALCYQLCGSPSCALQDNTIPGELATPPVLLTDGGVSVDPCDDIRARALQIRQQGCAQCHAPPQNVVYNFVLDDVALETQVPSGATSPLVIPGNPAGSLLIQKVQLGLAGDKLGMPPPAILAAGAGGISSTLAATIVYPGPDDLSVLEAWVQSCVPGADAGSYTQNYYGGNHGPDGGAGGASSTVATPDAGGNTATGASDGGRGPG